MDNGPTNTLKSTGGLGGYAASLGGTGGFTGTPSRLGPIKTSGDNVVNTESGKFHTT